MINNIKRSQTTIFIIIAVIIVAGVALFFIIMSKTKPTMQRPSMDNPQAYIEQCAQDAALKAIEIMLPQGGWINPTNYKLYEDTKIAYLCYTNLFYKSCTMQEPLYIKHLNDEITSYVNSKIDECFNNLKTELENKKYNVYMESMNVTTELSKNAVRINIKRKLTIERNGESRKFDSFNSVFNTPIYNLAIVAQEIANQEAKYCTFEYIGYMIFYPEYNITKKSIGQGIEASKIYKIQDRYTGKKLNIAIRSCAIPAGF